MKLIDITTQPWEPNPGIPGGRMKPLVYAGAGWTQLIVNWIPPDLGSEEPHRHYHRSVRERGLVLQGELPMAEFVHGREGPGVAVNFRAGFYMDRAPGCIHGLDPSRRSQCGFTMIEWRDGPGTYLLEETAATETVVEDAPGEVGVLEPDPRAGVVIERDDLRLLDVLELPWKAAAKEPGVRAQVLSPGEVEIAYAPPETALVMTGPTGRGYVLSGSAGLGGGADAGPGTYIEDAADAPANGVATEVGCRVLRF